MAKIRLASKYEQNKNLASAALIATALVPCLGGAALAQAAGCGVGRFAPWRPSTTPPALTQQPLQLPGPVYPPQPLAPVAPAVPFVPPIALEPPVSLPPSTAPSVDVVIPTDPGSNLTNPASLGDTTSNLPVAPKPTPPSPSNPPAAPGPTFSDNFANGIDPTKWGYNYPWSDACDASGNSDPTQDAAYMSPNCSSEAGAGVFSTGASGLNIAIKPTPPGVDASGKPYVTGQIRSQQAFTVGHYFEMTAVLPTTQGVGGAFWLLPSSGVVPTELDAMESLGQDPTTVYSTIHSNTGPQEQVATTVPGGVQVPHTYGVDWQPDTTTFYTDGVKTGSFATPPDMQGPMYMILSMNSTPANSPSPWGQAVGSSSQFPQTFNIQDVRVLDKAP